MEILDNNYCGAAVYAIMNMSQNKMYIGSSMNYQQRAKTHVSGLKNNSHICKEMQNDFNCSPDSWQIRILEKLTYPLKHELMNCESNLIQKYEKQYTLYNKVRAKHNHLYTKDLLLHTMADKYCIEQFGVSFDRYTSNRNDDFIEMTYLIINAKSDQERESIQQDYNKRLELRKAAKRKARQQKAPE